MKNYLTGLILVLCLCATTARPQGTFRNLGFESATIAIIPGDPYGSANFPQALPGWTGYVGTATQDRALYNTIFLDTSGISIIDTKGDFPKPLNGNYSVIIQAGIGPDAQPANTTLSQTGIVPIGTQSLLFQTGPIGLEYLSVSLNGQPLALTSIATGTGLWGADIHAWSGQTATLAFTVSAEQPHEQNRTLTLDSIQFSPTPVPEPQACSLLIFGIGTLLAIPLPKKRSNSLPDN